MLSWQILRRLPQPLPPWCRFFNGPQISEKCLNDAILDGLALPCIWIHFWMGFWVFLFITEELARTFLSLLPGFAITETMKFGEIKFVFVLAWFSDFSGTINAFHDTVCDLITIPCCIRPSTVSFLIAKNDLNLNFLISLWSSFIFVN